VKIYALFPVVLLLLPLRSINAQPVKQLVLEKIHEPEEKAFIILKPRGWKTEGGIVRWDPVTSGGAANAIEAKIDFTLKSDNKGTVQIHWVPDIYYADLSGSYAGGMFPEGSTYNGMPVPHKMNAAEFLNGYLIPYLHPQAGQMEVISSRNLPEIEQLCYNSDQTKQLGSIYSAAAIDIAYAEGGTRFRERAFCIIQDMGPYAAGMWKNRNTVVVRAPFNDFDIWEPAFHEIGNSVVLNPDWITAELKAQMQRGSTMIQTMNDIARIGEEIQKRHAETNAKINHQAYLYLTDQEDYINPHTQAVERGSNQWDYRWVDDLGNLIYTNNGEYNPNLDLELQMDGFKRSRVKRD
jgi:hypothetical protein